MGRADNVSLFKEVL